MIDNRSALRLEHDFSNQWTRKSDSDIRETILKTKEIFLRFRIRKRWELGYENGSMSISSWKRFGSTCLPRVMHALKYRCCERGSWGTSISVNTDIISSASDLFPCSILKQMKSISDELRIHTSTAMQYVTIFSLWTQKQRTRYTRLNSATPAPRDAAMTNSLSLVCKARNQDESLMLKYINAHESTPVLPKVKLLRQR